MEDARGARNPGVLRMRLMGEGGALPGLAEFLVKELDHSSEL